MNSLSPLIAVITGILLRLAIPVSITAITVYILRRLDRRWQAEAQEQLSQPAVEKPKCWEYNRCPLEKRDSCPGYNSGQPCWQVFREDNGYLQERCLGCNVFQSAPIPTHT